MTTIYKSEQGKQAVLDGYRQFLAAWPVKNKQYTVPTAFGDTFVIESGDPAHPPLVLLHGSMSSSFSWFGDVPLLSQHYHVFAVDLLGEAGLSAESRPDYWSGAYQHWLDEVLVALSAQPCAIVGLSLGGWMALRYATVHPQKVSHLALLCPGGLAMQRRDFLLRLLLQQIMSLGNQKKAVGSVLGMEPTDPAKAAEMRKVLDYILLINKNELPRYQTLPVFSDDELSRLTMPLLVVFGEDDMLLNARKSVARIARLAPHAQTVLLPGIGHAVLHQTQRILSFLTADNA